MSCPKCGAAKAMVVDEPAPGLRCVTCHFYLADSPQPLPLRCERCGANTEHSPYRNVWHVEVGGEEPHAGAPYIGVEHFFDLEIEICDGCAGKPDAATWACFFALQNHLAFRRSPEAPVEPPLTAAEERIAAAVDPLDCESL